MWFANVMRGIRERWHGATAIGYDAYGRIELTREQAERLYALKSRAQTADEIMGQIMQDMKYYDNLQVLVHVAHNGHGANGEYARMVYDSFDRAEFERVVTVVWQKDSLLVTATNEFHHLYHRIIPDFSLRES